MAYTINFRETNNVAKPAITVEDGTINATTGLNFPGRNSTAYGAVIAENFLRLLENFAGNTAPDKPVEGQIWYDNTLGEEKVMTYNGTNWIPAGGITRSNSAPAFAQIGDLWVDKDNQQLYLFTGGGWILVGPTFSEGLATGARADQIVGQDNNLYNILRIEVNGVTVGIVSGNDVPFTPKSTIAGFGVIQPGFNVINRDIDADGLSNFKFFGTAEKAESLIVNNEVVAAGDFLRGDVTSTTTNPINVQNNQGISYGINGELTVGVEGQAGIIQQNIGGANIDMRVRNNNITRTVVRVDSNLRVGINTEAPDEALDVVGNIQASGNLIVNSTTDSTSINNGAAIVRGGAAVKLNLNVGGETSLGGLTTTKDIVPDSALARDIGSSTVRYNNIYASTLIGNVVGNVQGTITGQSSESNKLTSRTTFIMEGDVTTVVPVEFDGQFQDSQFDNGSTIDPVTGVETQLPTGEQPLQKKFRTEISNSFVNKKPIVTDVEDDDLLLIDDVEGDSPGLKAVTKENLLKTIPTLPAGVLMPYGGSTAPLGWYICDGRELEINDGTRALFEAIRFNFGAESEVTNGFFKLPDLRGRMPLGADNMGTQGSGGVITESYGSVIGATGGAEEKLIDISNLPEHKHTLKDESNNQYYVYQDRQDPTTDPTAEVQGGLLTSNNAQRIPNSGGVLSNQLGQEFNIMPPTMTMNYIIYGGRL